MPADLRDVWRDEDGPSDTELDRWSAGELRQLELDGHAQRIVRIALKNSWAESPPEDKPIIDRLLQDLKATS